MSSHLSQPGFQCHYCVPQSEKDQRVWEEGSIRPEEPYKAVGRRVNHHRGRHLSVSASCPGIVWKAEEPKLANDKVGAFVLPAGPPTLLRDHASGTAEHKPPLHTHSTPSHACLSLLWDQVSTGDPNRGREGRGWRKTELPEQRKTVTPQFYTTDQPVSPRPVSSEIEPCESTLKLGDG